MNLTEIINAAIEQMIETALQAKLTAVENRLNTLEFNEANFAYRLGVLKSSSTTMLDDKWSKEHLTAAVRGVLQDTKFTVEIE